MKKVILVGSGGGAHTIIRAFAQMDINVTYIPSLHHDPAAFSRFISKKVAVISPENEAHRLLKLLMDPKEDWDGALLMPLTDGAVIFVCQNREVLASRYIPTVQENKVVERIINKYQLYLQAQKAGVPSPKVFFADSVQSLIQRQDELCYPCLLKPFESHSFVKIYNKKMFVIEDFDDLVEKFTQARKDKLSVMVSEIIPGKESCLFAYHSYIDSQGDILAEICCQKLRQYPPDFGVASVAKTVPIVKEVRQLALKLLKSLSYRGIAYAEFKYDSRDNEYKLIEINVRPILLERLFIAAGINIPYMAYMDLVENVKLLPSSYQTEVYGIHNFFEVIEFLRMLKKRHLTLRNFLLPYFKKKVFWMSAFEDPVPFIVGSWELTKVISRSIMERLHLRLCSMSGKKRKQALIDV